ncbi:MULTISPECIES: hypothetical protein [Mesorhizobium]|nr:hypothetical protein [Mesorhizobium sp. M4B.F.Ca.ET.089.01.1.1]
MLLVQMLHIFEQIQKIARLSERQVKTLESRDTMPLLDEVLLA